jgi:thioester reductase-like protein
MADKKTLLITGVTGTLGKEMIKELILTTEHNLYVLVRRKARQTHWDRMRKILAAANLERYLGTRVHVLEGDVTLPQFGLTADDLAILRREVSEFFHVAALTALNGSQEDCDKINIGGASQALNMAWDLLRTGRMKRFFYFSTAYVAGSRQTYRSFEDTVPENPAHANFYESSKYAAEKRVRVAMREGLPVTIFRPSIVVGDSRTGEVSEFNVIYPFMKLFAHGILTVLPTRLENSFNIVPIDFVIKASLAIAAQENSLGKTFHLVTQNPPTIGMLLKVKTEEYPQLPPVEVVSPDHFRPENLDMVSKSVFQMLEPYLGYLNDDLTFDTANTEKALEGTGITMPKTDYEFLKILIRYAVDAGYLILDDKSPVYEPAP